MPPDTLYIMRTLRFLYESLKEHRRVFWMVILVALVEGFLVNYVAVTIAHISPDSPLENEAVILQVIALIMMTLATSYLIRRYGETLALTTAEMVRSRLIMKFVDVPLLTLQKHHSGYLLSLVNRVSDTLQPVLFNLFWWGVRMIAFGTILVLMVARQSIVILVVDMIFVTIFVALSQWLSSRILVFNKDVNHAKSAFMSVFADFASNITTVRRLHLATYMESAIRRQRDRVRESVIHQQEFHSARWLMLHAVFALLFSFTFGLLVWQMHEGILGVGAFVTLIWFFFGLRGDLNQLAENLKVYTELGGYIDQIENALAYDDTFLPPGKVEDTSHAVEIRALTFAYPGTRTKISVPRMDVAVGDIVAITGASGQGKSTILHLIAGLLSPDTGTVKLGVSSHDIAIVSQEVELFNTSLRENITLGTTLSTSRIMDLMAELDLTKLISSHPEGLDVVIGEKGLRLSTGQKQRVNILRAFVQRRSLYLLDEPIAHLDPRTAAKTVAFIRRHLRGRTCVIVSHQPLITDIASRVYTMRHRKLIALS